MHTNSERRKLIPPRLWKCNQSMMEILTMKFFISEKCNLTRVTEDQEFNFTKFRSNQDNFDLNSNSKINKIWL